MAFVTIHAKATICDHSSVNNSSYLYSPGSGRHTHAAALPGNGKSLKLCVFLVYVRSSERELISCERDNILRFTSHLVDYTVYYKRQLVSSRICSYK